MTIPTNSDRETSHQPIPDSALRDLVTEYLDIDRSGFAHDVPFADIGLDSIAAVQLADELKKRFKIQIHSDDLFSTTLDALLPYLRRIHSTEIPGNAKTPKPEVSVEPTPRRPQAEQCQANDSKTLSKALHILSAVSSMPVEQLKEQSTLSSLGIDSFSALELKDRLENAYPVHFKNDEPDPNWTVQELCRFVKDTEPEKQNGAQPVEKKHAVEVQPKQLETSSQQSGHLPNPFNALAQSDKQFDEAARKRGFTDYWTAVAPLQNDLLLAYINEAFISLGVDLSEFPHGVEVPDIPHLSKYNRLIGRLFDILESRYVVLQRGGKVLRGSDRIDVAPSSELCDTLRTKFPAFECDANLMGLVGPRLAECLSGKTNPVSVLFGSATSLDIMQKFYSDSPMQAALTDQLITFLLTLLKDRAESSTEPVRILEVGAGTGGTTARLAAALADAGISVQYTFTDIGPAFVSKARTRFAEYPWMDFSLFNLEEAVSEEFRGKYDLVLGANVVHATTNRIAACGRLRETLRADGVVVLSEITHLIDWFDICFGLLDGWWLAEGGKGYPIQPADVWMDVFDRAGFASMGFSTGPSEEANTQQLLVASTKEWDVPSTNTV